MIILPPRAYLLLLLAAPCAVGAEEPYFTAPAARAHFEEARRIAGTDFAADFAAACRKPVPPRVLGQPPAAGSRPAPSAPRPPEVAFEPTHVFDNVYYFGSPTVGATAIVTPAGIILIDSLTLTGHARDILVAGMKRVGLDPAQIRYVVLTHAHGDHHGGVKYLRENYPQFRVVMSEVDWAYSLQPYYMADGSPDPAPKPPRRSDDIGYKDRLELELGGTKLLLIETPGHTPGTTSLLYTVQQGGNRYGVMHWGGGTPGGVEYPLPVVERFMREARAAKPAVRWSSHTNADSQQKLATIRNTPDAPNPFVEDPGTVARYMDVVLACKRAVAVQSSATGR